MPYHQFNLAVGYDIRKVQETKFGLDTNDTHQVFTYADHVKLIF